VCLKTRMVAMPKQADKTVDEIAQQRLNTIPAGRFGDPLEYGQSWDYICCGPTFAVHRRPVLPDRSFLKDGRGYPGVL
jgi:hypothetical protein